jgi:tRNA pseudouridine65 synthase
MLTLLHASPDLIAIDKPAGLLVHPSALDMHERVTALGLLQAQIGGKLYPLHRLDKATSGVLLFARSAEAARHWRGAFDRGEAGKHYRALVRGWPPERGTIAYALARDPERPSEGQPRVAAVTHYERLACFEWPFSVGGRHATSRYALMDVRPETGRRHQIRRHFKHIAHPLVGDTTHGKGDHNRAVAAYLGIDRLWLHAVSLSLPGGLHIEAPLPPEWLRLRS